MKPPKELFLNWSTGKDAAYALYQLQKKGYTVTKLLTTINAHYQRISMHGLRVGLLEQLAKKGVKAVFPLWEMNTKRLLQDFLNAGFKAITVCVNAQLLDKSFVGRVIDEQFIQDLPPNVDPCGENGEFHTFCFNGPIFKQPIGFEIGDIVYKTYPSPTAKEEVGFWFCDLIPTN